jgi:hypothetical protein
MKIIVGNVSGNLLTKILLLHVFNVSTPLLHYAITPLRHYAITPLRQYASTPVRQYASTPVCQYASKPVRQYASTPIRQYASMPVRQYASCINANTVCQYYILVCLSVLTLGRSI